MQKLLLYTKCVFFKENIFKIKIKQLYSYKYQFNILSHEKYELNNRPLGYDETTVEHRNEQKVCVLLVFGTTLYKPYRKDNMLANGDLLCICHRSNTGRHLLRVFM